MPTYESFLYGNGLYGIPASSTLGSGGAQSLHAHLYRADVNNVLLEDLSEWFVGGLVDFNLDRDIRTTAQLTLRSPGFALVNPYTDFLAPFVHFVDSHGTDYGHAQLGLFALRVPPATYEQNSVVGTFAGEDVTSLLLGSAYTDTDNVASTRTITEEVIETCGEAGLTRVTVPSSVRTYGANRSFPAGTTRLDKINAAADLVAWYHPYASLDGRVVIPGLYRQPSARNPVAHWTADDLVRPIEVQPVDQVPRNVVVVVKDNPSGPQLTGLARNDDPASPSSTVATEQERVRVERVSDAQTQADVDALAARLLAEERLRYRTANWAVYSPPVLEAFDVVTFALEGELAPLAGTWACRSWQYGFTPDDALLVMTGSQTMDESGAVL